jgi:hypothetical protein
MYAKRCPHCGSYLDPGERCDCSIEKAAPVIEAPEAAKVNIPVTY